MIVVVASCHDVRAQNILARWGLQCARILTAEDLCSSGWSLPVPWTERGTAVIGGEIVEPSQISGILTLRSRVFPQELQTIRAADRAYVAAELTAFLLTWLAAQSCPVLNRPTAACLAGPNWRPEQWTLTAARLGIPVRRRRRWVPHGGDGSASEEEAVECVAIGNRCFGDGDPAVNDQTLRLARKAQVELLSAQFSLQDGCFLSAHPWPVLTDPAALAELRRHLECGR